MNGCRNRGAKSESKPELVTRDSMKTEEFNPYAAPVSQGDPHDDSGNLAPDTEFLASTTCILCDEKVVLPRLCIQTATRNDVVETESSLTWTPALLHIPKVILSTLSALIIIQALFLLMLAPGNIGPAPWWVYIAFGAVIAGWCLVTALAHRFTRQVRITWFLNRTTHHNQTRFRQLLLIAAVLFVLMLVVSIVAGEYVNEAWFGMSFWCGLGAVIVLTVRKRWQIGPQFNGRYNDLNVIQGLSPKFLHAILKMIHGDEDDNTIAGTETGTQT